MQTVNQIRRMNETCIQLYNRIVAFIGQFGYPPSLREMATLMDINSTSLIAGYMRVLESWGWIAVTNNKSRTLRLTRPTEIEVPLKIREGATVVSDRLAEEEDMHVGQWLFFEVNR